MTVPSLATPANITHYDVVIVGSGLVGSSLALALSKQMSVALIESKASTATVIEDRRPLTLSAASQRIFQALGVWQVIQAYATPIQRVHVSCQGHFSTTQFAASDYKLSALGYVISAAQLIAQLQECVREQRLLAQFYSSQIVELFPTPFGYRIHLRTPQGNRWLHAKLLVAADGAHSLTRQQLGIAMNLNPATTTALTAVVNLSRSHNQVAYERFVADSVLAALPFAAKQMGIVWMLPIAQAKQYRDLANEEFCQRLQTAFGYRLGRLLTVEARQYYPVQRMQAAEQIRPHAVLLGNAARVFEPIAAQGFNLALRDVAVLVEVLLSALQTGQNIGDLAVLKQYGEQRAGAQTRTITMTRAITAVFASKQQWAKELSLLALGAIPASRDQLARQALGEIESCPLWVMHSAVNGAAYICRDGDAK